MPFLHIRTRSSRNRTFPRFAAGSFKELLAAKCLGCDCGPAKDIPVLPPLTGNEPGVWPLVPIRATGTTDERSGIAERAAIAAFLLVAGLACVGLTIAPA